MTDIRPKAGTKEWLGLVVIVLVTLLIAIDISVLGFAITPVSEALKPSATQLLWIMDIYSFVLAGALITMGWIGDRFGRRKLLIIGALVFGAASALAATADSAVVLIGARALLGLGAATLTPTSLALIRNMFQDSAQRKTAIAAWGGTLATGAAIGPVVGGLLLNNFWWGSVFVINTPVMVLVLILAPILLPERRDLNRGKLDVLGALLSIAGIMAFIYGLKELVVDGYSQSAAVYAAVGAVLLIGFVQRQRMTSHPLIDVALFRYSGFVGAIITNLMVMFSFMGISILTNQYLQVVLGMTPFKAALWSICVMPGIGIAVALVGAFSRKVKPVYLVGAGMLVMAVGFGVISTLTVESNVAVLLVGVGLMAGGMTASKTLTAEIVVTSAPKEQAGASTATSETFTEFGSAFGFAVIGSIGSAIYRHDMAAASLPGLDGEALEAVRNTIGGAATVAARQPGTLGSQLMDTSREAFTHGLQVAALSGAAAMVVVGALVVFLLRNVPVETEKPVDPMELGDYETTPDSTGPDSSRKAGAGAGSLSVAGGGTGAVAG
ncbi:MULTISPECIES: MFS transporter [Streptomyces]|uniref:MFS transporter n=1 Tax=Streptomyces TaxID=1883 RepID=UPI000D523EF2|nr:MULTISPECIES: MFS transporter [Streptomyces]PVC66906.1 MFS transporter [Streptomyces sp. CS065A]